MGSQALNRFIPAVISAFLCFVILDFFAHAILLTSWWRDTESYWLPPAALFNRIPVAYAAFAIYCVTLVWLQVRLPGASAGIRSGLRLGAILGLSFGCVSVLAAYSVLRMPLSVLLIWPASFLTESIGAAIGSSVVMGAVRPWRRALLIFALTLFLFVLGVGIQTVIGANMIHLLLIAKSSW